MKFYFLTTITFLFLAIGGNTWIGATEIISHRGGKAEFPENTILAFQECINHGVKTLEIDVQVTKDGIVVVYHPGDLSANTNGKGSISNYIYSEIKNLDAAYLFEQNDNFIYRGQGGKIPTLEEVITTFPETRLILDLKSFPADTLINAVAGILNTYNAWERVMFYSTSDNHLDYLKAKYQHAKAFVSRRVTLEEILTPNGSVEVKATDKQTYLGFELARDVILEESLALGKVQYPLKLQCWNKENITRIRQKLPKSYIVMFGINTVEDYNKAIALGADAVYSDNPVILLQYSKQLRQQNLFNLNK